MEAISGNDFIKAFQPTSLEIPQDVEQTLLSIISVLRDDRLDFGIPIIVSYRKIKAIRYYYNIAGRHENARTSSRNWLYLAT